MPVRQSSAQGQRDTKNSNDSIYSNVGTQMTLAPTGDTTNGFAATFNIALDLSDAQTGQADTNTGPGGGAGGGPGGTPPGPPPGTP